jgi:hypothetical protein
MVGRSLAVNLTEEEARYLHEQLALMLSDTPTP